MGCVMVKDTAENAIRRSNALNYQKQTRSIKSPDTISTPLEKVNLEEQECEVEKKYIQSSMTRNYKKKNITDLTQNKSSKSSRNSSVSNYSQFQENIINHNNSGQRKSQFSDCLKAFQKQQNLNIIYVQDINTVYEMGEILGKGNFGVVHSATKINSNFKVAIKIVPKSKCATEVDKKYLFDEIQILQKLDHPNVLKALEFLEDSTNYYIVTEQLNGISLKELIKEKTFCDYYNSSLACSVIKQLLSALNYLHNTIHVIHRDLKPENIMFTDNSNSIIKIIDFGCSTFYEPGQQQKTLIGTPYFLSPEILNKNYNEKTDLWAVGVIMYYMFTNRMPFNGQDLNEMLDQILNKNIILDKDIKFKNVPESALILLLSLLTKDPQKRCNALEALQNRWIQKTAPHYHVKTLFLQKLCKSSEYSQDNLISKAISTYIKKNLINYFNFKQIFYSFSKLQKKNDGIIHMNYIKKLYLKKTVENENPQQYVEQIAEQICDSQINPKQKLTFLQFAEKMIDEKDVFNQNNLKNFFAIFYNKETKTLSLYDIIELFYQEIQDEIMISNIKNQFCELFGAEEVHLAKFLQAMIVEQ